MTRVLIAAAGTGGHVFPALAVANELLSQGHEVSWLGTTHGVENRVIDTDKIPLHTITMRGMRGKRLVAWMTLPFRLLRAWLTSWWVFHRVKPEVVLAMGGFITGPAGFWARCYGCRLVLHEQNAIAGTANRWMSYAAHAVMGAYPNVWGNHDKQHHTGNPVRRDMLIAGREQAAVREHGKRVLVVGGTLGARAINRLVSEAWSHINTVTLEVKHMVGPHDADMVDKLCHNLPHNIDHIEFIDDMSAAYSWADVVICRAGAMTVSELMVMGVPAILIPLPSAIDDHQTHNAKYISDQDAGVLMPQSELDSEALAKQLMMMLADQALRQAMRDKLHSLAPWDATERVVQICLADK